MKSGGAMKRDSKKKVEMIVDLFLLVFVLVLAGGMYRYEQEKNPSVKYVTEGWYQLKDGDKEELALPAKVQAGEDGKILLYNDSLKGEEGSVLSVSNVQNELQILVGDQVLYSYKNSLFERNNQMKGKLWGDAILPSSIKEGPLVLSYTCKPRQVFEVEAPYYGSMDSIISRHISENYLSLLVIAGIFALAIVAIMIFLYGMSQGMRERRFFDMAIFLFLTGIWCVTDSALYQMYGGEVAAGGVISFYSFMLLAIPMVHFVKNTGTIKKYILPDLIIGLFYGNAVIQGLVHSYFKISFVKMLGATHILLVLGVVSLIYLLWKEYKAYHREQVKICLTAFGAMSFGGILSLILYWAFQIYWYDVIFQLGILLAIGIMTWGILREIIYERQLMAEEEAYERMSGEDRLTGLKNRKAFEQYLSMVQNNTTNPKETLLVFVDLEDLHQVNEDHGNAVGDEMVMGAARCIQRACEIFENEIKCFRIHGDEFAVVLLPGADRYVWEKRLYREVEKYNRTGHHPFRLTCGYGVLEEGGETIKSLSQWKWHTDYDLEKQKGGEKS